MNKSKAGSRHILLIPQRAMGRLWKPSFLVGILLAVILWQSKKGNSILANLDNEYLLFAGMIFSLLFGVFTLAARNMNYVQAYPSQLRLVTPFLKLKISYKRIQSSHPVQFGQIYPPSEMKKAQLRALKPFLNKTALSVRLSDYPLSQRFLRLFLPQQVFLPSEKGFLFVVKDWMALSTEIDSRAETWRTHASRQKR